jgi:hypothetical protein
MSSILLSFRATGTAFTGTRFPNLFQNTMSFISCSVLADVNEQKTKVLIQSKERRCTEREISIGNVKLEVVSNFTYLGTRLTNKNEELEEIQSRI